MPKQDTPPSVDSEPRIDNESLELAIQETNRIISGVDLSREPFRASFDLGKNAGSILAVNAKETVQEYIDVCRQRTGLGIQASRASTAMKYIIPGVCGAIIQGRLLGQVEIKHDKVQKLVALAHVEVNKDLLFDRNSQDGVPTTMPDWIYQTQTSKWLTVLAKQLQGKPNANIVIAEICNTGLIPESEVAELTKSPALKKKLAKLRRG